MPAAFGTTVLHILAKTLGRQATAPGDAPGWIRSDLKALLIAAARLLDLRLGALALGTAQLLELGTPVSGAMGMVDRLAGAFEQLAVLGSKALEVALAPEPPEPLLIALSGRNQPLGGVVSLLTW